MSRTKVCEMLVAAGVGKLDEAVKEEAAIMHRRQWRQMQGRQFHVTRGRCLQSIVTCPENWREALILVILLLLMCSRILNLLSKRCFGVLAVGFGIPKSKVWDWANLVSWGSVDMQLFCNGTIIFTIRPWRWVLVVCQYCFKCLLRSEVVKCAPIFAIVCLACQGRITKVSNRPDWRSWTKRQKLLGQIDRRNALQAALQTMLHPSP